MKKHLLALLATALVAASGCEKDRLDFYLDNFTVNEQFVDDSGRYAPDAILDFDIRFRSDDGLGDDYGIEDFDFTYTVNGSAKFGIQSDRDMHVNSFNLLATVDLLNLELPDELQGELLPGDEINFLVRATDSDGDSVERSFLVKIQ